MSLILSLLVLLPFVFALLIPLLPQGKDGKALHGFAWLGSIILLVLSLFAWTFPLQNVAVQVPWLPLFGMSWALGADGISLTLATLTSVLGVMAVMASFTTIKNRLKLYYSLIFILLGSVLGLFLARDLFLFFLFFELELIPMYLLIAIWGGPNRQYAAMKFVLYTLFGSVFLLCSIFGLYSIGTSLGVAPESLFMFDSLKSMIAMGQLPATMQTLLFLGFFIAFSVKLPVVPVHTWLPDAHVEAPTPVSMLLAGILLKMGAYGMLRFCFEWLPDAAVLMAPFIGLLAVINIVFTAGVALVQTDMKKLIAYSSVSHMGFVLLALAALNSVGMSAAVFIMVSHGLVSAALFMGVGTLYRRTHSRLIADYSGVGQKAPVLFYFFLLMSMASLGLPALISFPGETLVFYGAFISNAFSQIPFFGGTSLPLSIQTVAGLSTLGVVIGAAYMLWLVKRVFFGPTNDRTDKLTDATRSEVIVMASLALLVIGFGFFPNLLTQRFQKESLEIAAPYAQRLAISSTPSLIQPAAYQQSARMMQAPSSPIQIPVETTGRSVPGAHPVLETSPQ